MNKYIELRNKHQKEVDEFPFFFAFNDKQFEEGMKKIGLKPTDTDKIYKFGNTGGFYAKTDAPKLREMFNRHDKEMNEAMKDDEFVYQMFRYELMNHEYFITYNYDDTLNACGLSEDDLDERLVNLLNKAKKDYLADCKW